MRNQYTGINAIFMVYLMYIQILKPPYFSSRTYMNSKMCIYWNHLDVAVLNPLKKAFHFKCCLSHTHTGIIYSHFQNVHRQLIKEKNAKNPPLFRQQETIRTGKSETRVLKYRKWDSFLLIVLWKLGHWMCPAGAQGGGGTQILVLYICPSKETQKRIGFNSD